MFRKIMQLISVNSYRQLSAFTTPLKFSFTPPLLAEPMKKKKKLDPAIYRIREERKRKKIWKQIKKLTKIEKQLKPIEEIEVPYSLIDEKKQRTRENSMFESETLENRAHLYKKWTHYRHNQHVLDLQNIDRICCSQRRALEELRKESEHLYQEAIKIDENLIPFVVEGPVDTPPIKNYDSPDGEYEDITKKWD